MIDTRATDPLTLLFTMTLLVATSFIACVVPARGAARVDPMVSLRHE